jgi:MFS family permease
VASQTRDPCLVAAATLMLQRPALLFGLYAGALADRLDRRTVVLVANALRVGVLAVLCAFITTGRRLDLGGAGGDVRARDRRDLRRHRLPHAAADAGGQA